MTPQSEIYTVTLTEKAGVPAIVRLTEMEDDIGDLAFVGCEDINLKADAIPHAGTPLTLTLACNAAFAAEVQNTVGVASVQKQVQRQPALAL